jgi:hypothetical protein
MLKQLDARIGCGVFGDSVGRYFVVLCGEVVLWRRVILNLWYIVARLCCGGVLFWLQVR